MLNLTDPKYVDSPNLASYLITDLTDPYEYSGMQPELFFAVLPTVVSRYVLFNPARVASVTLHDPLPYNFTINNHGIISGYVESIDSEREDYKISLTITDIHGETFEEHLNISIINSLDRIPHRGIDPDPIIPYTLNFNCSTTNFCGGYCSQAGCYYGSCVCGEKSICNCV